MIRVWFREIADGRLQRLAYLGYTFLLVVVMLAVGIGVSVAVGLGEQVVGGYLATAGISVFDLLGLPVLLLMLALAAAAAFAGANMQAKRLRDIGLPGWPAVGILLVTGVIVSLFLADVAGGILNAIVWLALVLVPTGAASRDGQAGMPR